MKFEFSSSSSFGDMFNRMPQIVGSRDLGHAHFQGKFEVSSSSSVRSVLGYEFDLSRSRDVIGHVTIR